MKPKTPKIECVRVRTVKEWEGVSAAAELRRWKSKALVVSKIRNGVLVRGKGKKKRKKKGLVFSWCGFDEGWYVLHGLLFALVLLGFVQSLVKCTGVGNFISKSILQWQ